MNNLSDTYELFDRFLNDEMSESEKDDFQLKLDEDDDFKKEFDHYQDIIIGIKAASEEKLKEEFREIDKTIADPVIRSKSYYLYRIAAIIVVLLIGVALILLNKHQKSDEDLLTDSPKDLIDEVQKELKNDADDPFEEIIISPYHDQEKLLLAMNVYDEYFTAYPNNLIPQSRGIPTDSLELAMYYYQLDDYENCLAIMDDLIIQQPENIDFLFYSAICLMYKQDFDRALLYLQNLSVADDKTYADDVKWYTALVFLRTKQLNLAIDIFNHLASYNNEYKKSAEDIVLTFNEKNQ